jgi:hypothetical protein
MRNHKQMKNIKSVRHKYQNLETIYQEENRLKINCGAFIEFKQQNTIQQ